MKNATLLLLVIAIVGCTPVPTYSQNSRGFPGTANSYVTGSGSFVSLANTFTIAAWIKNGSVAQKNSYVTEAFFGMSNQLAIIYGYSSGEYQLYLQGGSGTNPESVSAITIRDTNWHHLAYTYNGATLAGYLDGVQTFSTPITFSTAANQSLIVGEGQNGEGPFYGSIGQLVLATTALTSSQIGNLAGCVSARNLGLGTALLGYWPLNAGTSLESDYSGHLNNLVVTGTTVVSGPPACANFSSYIQEQSYQSDSFVDSIGVNTHFGYGGDYANTPMIQAALTTLGVRHARDQFTCNYMKNGVYANMASVANHTGMLFDLISDPRYFNLVCNATYDQQIASIGAASIESVEGPNEYDESGDPTWMTDVVTYQNTLFSTITRDSNPTVAAYPIISFSMAFPYDFPSIGNRSSILDYTNLHSYPGGNNPSSTVNPNYSLSTWITDAAIVGGLGKPIYATETGYTNNPNDPQGVSEAASGKYIPRLLLGNFNSGIKRTYIYELSDQYSDPTFLSSQVHFGLLRYGLVPKPAFTNIANMIGILSDKGSSFSPSSLTYYLSGNIANVMHTLLQKRNGRLELVLWLEVPSYDLSTHTDISVTTQSVTVNLQQSVGSYNIYDPSISSSPQSSGSNSTSVTILLRDSLQILELVQSNPGPMPPANLKATIE